MVGWFTDNVKANSDKKSSLELERGERSGIYTKIIYTKIKVAEYTWHENFPSPKKAKCFL